MSKTDELEKENLKSATYMFEVDHIKFLKSRKNGSRTLRLMLDKSKLYKKFIKNL